MKKLCAHDSGPEVPLGESPERGRPDDSDVEGLEVEIPAGRRSGECGSARLRAPELAQVQELEQVHASAGEYTSYDEHVRVGACGGLAKCGRCFFEKHRKCWQVKLGTHIGGSLKCPIVERPKDWGGPWGIGCAVCARAGKRGKYANFTVRSRSAVQICNLMEHCAGQAHKRALQRLQDPSMDDVPSFLKLGDGGGEEEADESGWLFKRRLLNFDATGASGDAGGSLVLTGAS